MTFFNRKSDLIKELKEQLSAAEDMNLTLQNEVEKEREEKNTMEKALQEDLKEKRWTEERHNSKQTEAEPRRRTSKLDEKEKLIQEVNESLRSVKEEKHTILESIKDMIRDMSLDHTQQVSKLKQDKEEAFNATKIIQEELEQQHQLRKSQSEVWESSKKELEDKMLRMMEEMVRLKEDLLETQTNLDQQKRETETTLDRAEMVQTQLNEEREKSKGLQEQKETLRAAFVKLEQEKMNMHTDMVLKQARLVSTLKRV
ncbi:hypothetical protein WMY93_007289 [Mugilogobius chulae]|uniref:Uncharacterized protein n=1 Tax=Mugilogobius chulae TaxID=88201 RepID=A0AAW0PXT9_9GOBI